MVFSFRLAGGFHEHTSKVLSPLSREALPLNNACRGLPNADRHKYFTSPRFLGESWRSGHLRVPSILPTHELRLSGVRCLWGPESRWLHVGKANLQITAELEGHSMSLFSSFISQDSCCRVVVLLLAARRRGGQDHSWRLLFEGAACRASTASLRA